MQIRESLTYAASEVTKPVNDMGNRFVEAGQVETVEETPAAVRHLRGQSVREVARCPILVRAPDSVRTA